MLEGTRDEIGADARPSEDPRSVEAVLAWTIDAAGAMHTWATKYHRADDGTLTFDDAVSMEGQSTGRVPGAIAAAWRTS